MEEGEGEGEGEVEGEGEGEVEGEGDRTIRRIGKRNCFLLCYPFIILIMFKFNHKSVIKNKLKISIRAYLS